MLISLTFIMRRKLMSAGVAAFLLWLGLVSLSHAHSPYFDQRETIELPKFGIVEFAILNGDGIFFADPSQVVVFDRSGKLLAATRQSVSLSIHCNRSDITSTCLVYDGLEGIIYEPAYAKFAPGRIIEEDGRPPRDAYPEYMNIEYGFTQRTATFKEKVYFESINILSAPISTLVAVFWWAGACSFLTGLVWRWRSNGWRVWPISSWAIVSCVLSILAFFGMSLVAAYMFLLDPISDIFFFFSFLSGAVLSTFLTRPKKLRTSVEPS